jgi:chemotaxis protein CheD
MQDVQLMDIFLLPGEFFVGDAGFQIRTVLGSCVSITLWHPLKRIGGMCHFLLPTRGASSTAPKELDGHYGDEALELMCRDLRGLGVEPRQCEAKIFGGGHMFPGRIKVDTNHVGRRNGEAARELLAQHGIAVLTESLFGVGHRQIIFDVSKGDVWARQVKLSIQEVAAELDAQGKLT